MNYVFAIGLACIAVALVVWNYRHPMTVAESAEVNEEMGIW